MPKHGAEPQRRCLVTRQSLPQTRLLRFVLGPEGEVVPDIDQRLPGRGMWLSAERDVLNRAVTRNLFAKAARQPARVGPGLVADVERLLVRRALGDLGLARRAGELVMGFEQVRERLRSGSAAVLVSAADGARDGRAKLRRLAPHVPLITAFSSEELGAALGRPGIIHLAVAPGALARRFVRDVERLAGFREGAIEWPQHPAPAPGASETRATTGPT